MDNYTEQIIQFKSAKRNDIVSALGVTFIFWGIVFLCFINGGLGLTFIIIGGVIKSFGNKPIYLEYEYLFVNGDCDISRIKNQARRKEVFSFRDGDVKRIIPYNTDKGKNEVDRRESKDIYDFTSGKKDNSDSWYVFIVDYNKDAVAVIMELDETNIDHCTVKYKKRFEK